MFPGVQAEPQPHISCTKRRNISCPCLVPLPNTSIKRTFQILIAAILLVQCSTEQRNTSRPNVILVLTDDQGWNDVGFNGSLDIRTPHLDAIASEAIVFSQGYVSHPYCSPSRAGLLTGRYQQHFGHENNPGYPEYEDEVPDGLPLG